MNYFNIYEKVLKIDKKETTRMPVITRSQTQKLTNAKSDAEKRAAEILSAKAALDNVFRARKLSEQMNLIKQNIALRVEKIMDYRREIISLNSTSTYKKTLICGINYEEKHIEKLSKISSFIEKRKEHVLNNNIKCDITCNWLIIYMRSIIDEIIVTTTDYEDGYHRYMCGCDVIERLYDIRYKQFQMVYECLCVLTYYYPSMIGNSLPDFAEIIYLKTQEFKRDLSRLNLLPRTEEERTILLNLSNQTYDLETIISNYTKHLKFHANDSKVKANDSNDVADGSDRVLRSKSRLNNRC